jgi:hypothetical protein
MFLSVCYYVTQWQCYGFVCISHCGTVAVIVFDTVVQKESCELAWDLLVGQYGLNPSRLYVTYFGGDHDLGLGPDLETRDIWRQIG